MQVWKSVTKLVAVWSLVEALALIPSVVFAHDYVWHGDDYAYDSSNGHQENVCDGEDDGNYAYASYYLSDGSGGHRVTDLNGAVSGCNDSDYYAAFVVITHQVCEDINNWPDVCSNPQATGH